MTQPKHTSLTTNKSFALIATCAAFSLLLTAGCANTQHNNTQNNQNNAKTTESTTDTAFSGIESCTQAHGTLRITADTSSDWYKSLKADGLGSPQAVLERIVKESGCYTIATSNTNNTAKTDTNTATTANTHTLAPTAQLNKEAPSPFTIGFGSWGRHVGIGIQTRLRSTKASATLAITPPAGSTQNTLTATGEASKTNLGFFTGVSGHSGAVSVNTTPVGDYLKTREGKLVTAAFIDAYNKLVDSLNHTGKTAQQ